MSSASKSSRKQPCGRDGLSVCGACWEGGVLTVLLPVGGGEALGEQAVHGVAQVVQQRLGGGVAPPGLRHPPWIFRQVIPGVLNSFWKLLLEHLDAHGDA